MEIFSKEETMSFFRKNQSQAIKQENSEAEKLYNTACLNMAKATDDFKGMPQAAICDCINSCQPSSK